MRSPLLFYLAKFLEAAGIGTFAVAILVSVSSKELSPYGRMLPLGLALFGIGWLIERRLGTRPR
jgi:hypothetical protein